MQENCIKITNRFVLGYHFEEYRVGDRSSNLQWIGNQNNEELRVFHQYSPNQK